MTPGVKGIGGASLLADIGHEIPTALLPSLLTLTLGAPASALGVIEGVSDALAGVARFGGGALSDEPERRRNLAIGGYTATAVLAPAIAPVTATWHVAVLRAGAWTARGIRVPARNALLADVVPAAAYGRAYGFERAMDNLGAILGPLAAIALVSTWDTLGDRFLGHPGPLGDTRRDLRDPSHSATDTPTQTGAAVPHPPDTRRPAPSPVRGHRCIRVRQLRSDPAHPARHRPPPSRPHRETSNHHRSRALRHLQRRRDDHQRRGWQGHGPQRRETRPHRWYRRLRHRLLGFTHDPNGWAALMPWFILAGIGIGCVETAEHAAVATHAPEHLRGSAFGLLAATQSFGNLAASSIAGILWSALSPTWAFAYLAGAMAVALATLAGPAKLRLRADLRAFGEDEPEAVGDEHCYGAQHYSR